MKKVLLIMIGVMMLMSVSSFATETRTMVMGDNHTVLVDDFNMFMFPGRVNNYPNLAQGEFDYGDEMYQFGVTWQFNDDNPWVLGTYISTSPEFGPENFDGNHIAGFTMTSFDQPRRIQLLYGRQLGGQNFGFNFDVVRYSYEEEAEDYNPKESFSQYTVALGLTEATAGEWDVAVHFRTGTWTNEDPNGDKVTEPNGFYDLAVAGRYFSVRNPKVTLVPHVAFTIGKRGVDDFQGTPDVSDDDRLREWTRTAFDVGCGFHYTPAPNLLAVFDFGIMYEKIKEDRSGGFYPEAAQGEISETGLNLPYVKIGFEGEVFSWMDVRAGATASLWSNKETEDDKINEFKTMDDDAMNETFLGLGFHWNRLYLDTYMDPELVLDGFDFISGEDDGNPMNWKVSLTYEMF